MLPLRTLLCLSLVVITLQFTEDNLDPSSIISVPRLVLDSLHLTLSSRVLLDLSSPHGRTLKGYLGWLPLRSNLSYSSCSGGDSPKEAVCLNYGKDMKLLVMHDDRHDDPHCDADGMDCDAVSCYRIEWQRHIGGAMDCFILGEEFWYGGGEVISQRWPLQEDSRQWHPAVSGDPLHHAAGGIVENLWISSSGFLIYLDRSVPLFFSFNDSNSDKLCFSTSKKHPFRSKDTANELAYTVCTAGSVKEAQVYAMRRWFDNPKDIPDEDTMRYPIWSTWARYKRQINQTSVLRFARELKIYEFPASHLEIDDRWESCYGRLEFDRESFPDVEQMMQDLKDLGFAVSLWVHPFCNVECEDVYSEGARNGFWVKNVDGRVAQVKWWNGMAAVLDTTHKGGVEWFVARLKRLRAEFGVESFKFDAGEIAWLESNFFLHDESANQQPNAYTQLYAELAAKFGPKVEVRVGYGTQRLPIFVRMFDKFSNWDYANGLKTLIPNALHLSLMGYPFVLPDMIGGNNYASPLLPSRELYIRWLEASLFFPALQFSITPWDYDEETIQIARKMLQLRDKYAGHIIGVANQATLTGHPIIRPLWWASPDDFEALRTDSQYLVGDGILVAPVLEMGATGRDIYLPEGRWSDVQRGKTFEGPQWLVDHPAQLDVIPFFIRQT